MTDMEKKVMVWLCAKIFLETDLYDTDMEVRNLIDWIGVSEQIKSNNNEIRSLIGEYKRIESDCREGVRAQLERMKSLCTSLLGSSVLCSVQFAQVMRKMSCLQEHLTNTATAARH